MKRETYLHMTSFLTQRPQLLRIVTGTNTAITYAIYGAYPCLLLYLFVSGQQFAALRAFLVPFVGFCALTVVRAVINAPRPYEHFNAPSAIPKATQGKSFPSRHVFSIFVIGMTFLASLPNPLFGALVLLAGCVLACVRVVAGVHFPRDVIVGALAGILVGVLGF